MDASGRRARMQLMVVVGLGCAANLAAALEWSILSSPCPSGFRYLTMVEARDEAQGICAMIDDWTIVEVASHNGPGFGGQLGYQCEPRASLCDSGCTQSLCTRGKEGEGKGGTNEAEDIAIWAVTVFVCLSLYAGGGVIWHYYSQGELTHPHVAQWKQISGLVVDGIAFTKAKHAGTEFTPGRPVEEEKAPLNGKDQQPEGYSATASAKSDLEEGLPSPGKVSTMTSKPKEKKKKKKKKKKAEEGGEAKE